jgi:SAM-dependent methyltransferase
MRKQEMAIPCRNCDSPDSTFLFEKSGHRIVKCGKCGLVFLDLTPSDTELRDFYSESYYFNGGYQDYIKEKPFIQLNARRRIKDIRNIKEKGCLLEIGCALGFFLEEAKKDFKVNGLEISEYGSRYAREELGLDVRTGVLEKGAYPRGHFDVVVMWDVIEHLKDPKTLLATAREMMKPDGLLVFSTMDVGSLYARLLRDRWHLYDIPEHLVYYDRKTVSKLLDSAGFTVQKIKSEGSLYSIGYILYRLSVMYKSGLFSNIGGILSKLRIADALIRINLGDLMTVYARPKKGAR